MRTLFVMVLLNFFIQPAFGQINAKLMKYMDVSESQITFVYGGDIWVVSKNGGTAIQLTHSPGEESWPKFSPDGKNLAFTASYHGNPDIYTMPVTGGIPIRLTYHSFPDRMVEWHPDGQKILFASRRTMGQRSANQLFIIDKDGGMPESLSLPYGELASYSPDGSQLAYITKITENYPFKRYRGGLSSDILIYDINKKVVKKITDHPGNDGKPAWAGESVFYLSDQGANMRLNIWEYNTISKSFKQITHFNDFDISFLSAGPGNLVFEVGGILYLMDLKTKQYKSVEIQVMSDLSTEIARTVKLERNINNVTAAPGGKRVVFEARGELFNVPVKEGYTINLTQSSGAFDREPAWSPDGKYIAFWSDRSGEFEIYLQEPEINKEARKLTNRTKGFGYQLYWSPNSEKIAFIDETNSIFIVDVESGDVIKADKNNWNLGHGSRFGFPISWSPDSRWITYSNGLENANNAIFLYNLEEAKSYQLSSGFYEDSDPVFSTDGNYIFYLTNRNFSAAYSDMGDGTWIYPNSTQIASVSLQKDVPSLLKVRNDELELDKKKVEKDTSELIVDVDFDQIETRLVLLPADAGNIGGLAASEGKLIYLRFPNTGASGPRSGKLIYYDFNEREEKTIIEAVSGGAISADGKSLLVNSRGKYGIIKIAPNQKIEDPIPTDGLEMNLVPKEEWRQIFADTWRRYRDFFYDPAMHQVDWMAMKERYGALIDDARTRWDISGIQSNMQAELSAGHTYTRGGDVERAESRLTGFLGIDWDLTSKGYQIKRIVQPAVWDTEVRSPFDQPGLDVLPGDYILSVNGRKIQPNMDPYAAFEGLSGKVVSLQMSRSGDMNDARDVIIECLSPGDESRLRYLEWIEGNRKMVDELSNGQLGYIYMSNTSGRGQLELVRMFYGQLDKKGFIIDERFNGGGQLADRFLELLQRPVVYNLHWRHGKDHIYPIKTNPGPVGMLINGWAGSGGDGLPWAFQELKAGPIVGERTLGILVGPATGHQLIDGGGITVPGARLYDNDGHWFWEGEGVAPDIEVWDDPNIMMQGRDPQMERVVQEVLELLKTNPPTRTPAPKPEDRTAKGLKKN